MAARAPLCSLLFKYARWPREETRNKDEGVLDTRVLATHEARYGQPAGTEVLIKECEIGFSLVLISDSFCNKCNPLYC